MLWSHHDHCDHSSFALIFWSFRCIWFHDTSWSSLVRIPSVRGSWRDLWSKPSWWADRRFGCEHWDVKCDCYCHNVQYVWSLLKQVKQWRHQHHNITLLSMCRRPAPDPPNEVRGAYRTISAGRGWDPCNLVSIWSSIGRKSQVLYGSQNEDLKHWFISFISNWWQAILIDAYLCNWIEWSAAMSNVIKLNLLPQDQRLLDS